MKSDLDVKLTAGLAIAVFAVLVVLEGQAFWSNAWSVAMRAIGWTTIVRLAYVRWIWKWAILSACERVHSVPNLEGSWVGTFHSTGNHKTPEDRREGDIEVEITQPTIHTVKVTRRSDESVSHSFAETFERGEDGAVYLTYSYQSVPKAAVRDRSGISYGTARLVLRRGKPCRLEGSYWSDQKTTGDLNLSKVESKTRKRRKK